MNLPTIRQLECLVALAKYLNFGQAAESCYITQPAFSAQIKQLETILGVTLFERDRRSVLATQAGTALAGRAQEILADLKDFSEAANRFKGALTGTIRLGVIPTVAPYVLPCATREIHRQFPELRLLLHEGRTSELVALLHQGALDLLLLALEADLHDAETCPLFADPFLLAAPSDHWLAKKSQVCEQDIAGEQVLLLDDGHCLRDQALTICNHVGASEFGDFRASSLPTLLQMVAGGIGVTLLPKIAIGLEVERVDGIRAVPFSTNGPGRTVGLAWRKSSMRKAEFEQIGAAIQQGMAQ